MRLGIYPCHLKAGTHAAAAYQALGYGSIIQERHRHRFEFNNHYRAEMEAAGMVFSGLSPDGRLVEISELSNHPYMVGSQFHPEFKSRPTRPHPLFLGFVKAAQRYQEQHQSTAEDQKNETQENSVPTSLAVAAS
jgi:CTP synthase